MMQQGVSDGSPQVGHTEPPAAIFGGLEPLEPRLMLSSATFTPTHAASTSAAAIVMPLADGQPLVITGEDVTIGQAVAGEIAAALATGRDVTVEATAGSITLAAPIVATQSGAAATLTLTAPHRVDLNARLAFNGDLSITSGIVAQATGSTLDTSGSISVLAQSTFNDDAGTSQTLIVGGTMIAGGQIELVAIASIAVNGSVRSEAALTRSPDSPPVETAAEAAVALLTSGGDSSVIVSGTITAARGSVFFSTLNLRLSETARVRSHRGHVTFAGEELRTAAGSLIEADRGDVVVIGQIFQSTLNGTVRAIGDARADVDLRLQLSAELSVASTALIETEDGAIRLAAGQLNVAGRVNTHGGAIAFDASTGLIEITGRVETGRVTTATTDQRGGDIAITVNGGSILINGILASNGGDITFTVRNGVSVDPQQFFDATLNRTRLSGITLGSKTVIDSRFSGSPGNVGGKITFDIGESDLIIEPGAQILSGGGDIEINATGSYQQYTIDPDGAGPLAAQSRTQFFASLVKIDGVIDTSNAAMGAGELNIPTQGVQLLLGTAAGSRFRAAAGVEAIHLSTAAALAPGLPSRGGSATLGGVITGGEVHLNVGTLRLQNATSIVGSTGDVVLDGGVIGINKTKVKGKARAKRVKSGGSSLTIRAAGDARLGGDLVKLSNLTLASGGIVELRRADAFPLNGGASTTAPIRLRAARTLTLDTAAVLARDHAISLRAKNSALKVRRPISLFGRTGVTINAPTTRLKAVNIVSAAAVILRLGQLRVAGGGVFANGPVTLKVGNITGRPFPAGSFVRKVKVSSLAPSAASKVQAIALPAAINPAAFNDPLPVFNLGIAVIPVTPAP